MEIRSSQGMHPIEKQSEAPELEAFFTSLTRNSALNYCVVCLRTEKERRLAKCKVFKEFSNVTKIQNNWQNHLICFICEHQAANALQFYKKAVFASRIHQILLEYLYQKVCVRKQLFKQHVFKEVLCKLGLAKSGDKTLPSEFEEELLHVRCTTQLNETKTLVIDNNEGKKPTDKPASCIDIGDGEITATAFRSSKTGQTETTGPGRPLRTPDSSTKQDRFKSKADKLMNLAQKPTNDSFELSSPQPKVSEALVILDDDEGSRDEEPYPIRIDKVVSNAVFSPPPQAPPKLVPIENLLEKRNENPFPVRVDKVVSNATSLAPAPKLITIQNLVDKPNEPQSDNIVLHPIVLSGGMLTVPTLSANILNGQLVYTQIDPNLPQNLNGPLVFQNGIQTSTSSLLPAQTNTGPMLSVSPLVENKPTNPLAGNQILPNILKKPSTTNKKVATKKLPKLNNNAPNQVFSMKDVFTDNKLNTEEIKNEKTNTQKVVDNFTNKRENDEMVSSNKKPKSLRAETDWEDKIPMDVISFMDAVDPNPTIIIPENSGLSKVQINRPQTIETGAEVIDLG